MGNCIEIVDWGKHYENNRTRELKKMGWVSMPNRHDGDGYTQLLDHPNGAAHFGAWCALVEVASRCHIGSEPHNPAGKYRDSVKYDSSDHPHGRGLLMREKGDPHDSKSLERITRIPTSVWDEAIPRLATIGWIRICEISALDRQSIGTESALDRQDIGDIPQEGAGECPMNGKEGKERKQLVANLDRPLEDLPAPSHARAREDATPPAAAFSLTALKKRLSDASILTSPSELEAIATELVARSVDCDAFLTWALAKAAKARQPSSWFARGLLEWNWIGKWRENGSSSKPAEPASYVPIEPHVATAEDDAEVERLAAEARAKLHMVGPPAEGEAEAAKTGELSDFDAIPF